MRSNIEDRREGEVTPNDIKARVGVVVPSCDAYSDVWPTLFASISQFWPESNYSKFLICNHKSPSFDGVQVIRVGDDQSWSSNLLCALEQVPHDYIFIHIDDLILAGKVEDDKINDAISQFVSRSGNYLRLNLTPPGTQNAGYFKASRPGDVYRSSTIFSIWKKEVLISTLQKGESAWEFEIKGTPRTDTFDNWFVSKKNLIRYENLIIKRKIDPRALRRICRLGLNYSGAREVLSGKELRSLKASELTSKLFLVMPSRLRRWLRARFKSS